MTGVVILAAGSSSRLGMAKQNLIYRDKTLLQHAIDSALISKAKHVVVVLGANAELILPTIKKLSVIIINNPDWAEGMASSIRLGVGKLQEAEPKLDSVILMLCDQPFVDEKLLNKLIENQTKKGIAASAYNHTLGAPVLFNNIYFTELLLLKGQEGAKKLLLKYPGDIQAVDFPLGSVDVDTLEDFEQL